MKDKLKKFDSVKMMREIRDKLSRKYIEHPELENAELNKIREKYNISAKEKVELNLTT